MKVPLTRDYFNEENKYPEQAQDGMLDIDLDEVIHNHLKTKKKKKSKMINDEEIF